MVGATYVARWRSGLTHMPFTHALMGSNPVRVTNNKITQYKLCFFMLMISVNYLYKMISQFMFII